MKTLIKPAALFMALGLLGSVAQAQDKKEESGKDKTIIFRPSKSGEKYSIIVDGGKVTINGKAVDEFKGEGVDVITQSGPFRMEGPDAGTMFKGGWNMAPGTITIFPNRALLGVVTEKTETGAKIVEISKESPAEKAGLKKDDIITLINDSKIETQEDLHKAVGQFKPGERINITYTRDGKEYKTTAMLKANIYSAQGSVALSNGKALQFRGSEPDMKNFRIEMMGKSKLGMQIKDMENEKGVQVMDITEESPASKAGLKKGDIIIFINDNIINTVAEVKKELAFRKENGEIKIAYLRNNKGQVTTIKFPKKQEEASL